MAHTRGEHSDHLQILCCNALFYLSRFRSWTEMTQQSKFFVSMIKELSCQVFSNEIILIPFCRAIEAQGRVGAWDYNFSSPCCLTLLHGAWLPLPGQLHRVRSLPGMEENEDSRGHHRKYPLEHDGNYTWLRILFLNFLEKVKMYQNIFATNFLAYKNVLQLNIPWKNSDKNNIYSFFVICVSFIS